ARRQIDGAFCITLIKSILGTNRKQLVSRNIIDDFSLEGRSVSELSNLQKELFRCLNNETRSEQVLMLFEEWMDIFHLSFNDDGKSNTIMESRDSLSKVLGVLIEYKEHDY